MLQPWALLVCGSGILSVVSAFAPPNPNPAVSLLSSLNHCNNAPVFTTRPSLALHAVQAAGLGLSDTLDTPTAVAQAVAQATQALNGAAPSLAFCSATVSRNVDEVRQAFVDALPDGTPIHGVTSSAALLSPGSDVGSKPGAVGCLLLASAFQEDFATAFDADGNGASAAASLKVQMMGDAHPQALFLSATPGAEEGILQQLDEVFPGVPVFGGTAADDDLSGQWSVFSSTQSSGTGVSLVGIGGGVSWGASMIGPYTPTKQTCVATKTDGRRVLELDGKPAADWVRAWLGEEVEEQYQNGGLVLPQTAQKPIAVQGPTEMEPVTAHCAAFGNKANGESFVDFFCPIPQGSTLTVMDSGDGPATGYASALGQAYDTAAVGLTSHSPKAGLLVYCGGMAIAVGDNLGKGLTSDEVTSKVGNLPVLGMTCFGEQACLPESKRNAQRNLSVGMVLFG